MGSSFIVQPACPAGYSACWSKLWSYASSRTRASLSDLALLFISKGTAIGNRPQPPPSLKEAFIRGRANAGPADSWGHMVATCRSSRRYARHRRCDVSLCHTAPPIITPITECAAGRHAGRGTRDNTMNVLVTETLCAILHWLSIFVLRDSRYLRAQPRDSRVVVEAARFHNDLG